jgi:hypothetical protein
MNDGKRKRGSLCDIGKEGRNQRRCGRQQVEIDQQTAKLKKQNDKIVERVECAAILRREGSRKAFREDAGFIEEGRMKQGNVGVASTADEVWEGMADK